MSEAKSKIEQYLEAMRDEVIAAAEKKLGRPLTPMEAEGVRSIKGGMMLESCFQSFSHMVTKPENVAKDLAFFVGQHGTAE